MELEKEIERYTKTIAEEAGFKLLKFTSPGETGVPDRVLLAPRLVVFIEFKRPAGGTYTAKQKYWADKLTSLEIPYLQISTKEQALYFINWLVNTTREWGL